MARIKLEAPEHIHFNTKITLRISDMNYGGHLGNDAVLSLAHEARVRFLKHFGYTELDVEGSGLIQSDTAIVYKSEGFYGDEIEIAVSVFDVHRLGFDLFYRMYNRTTEKELAQVKTGMITYNYASGKVDMLSDNFKKKFTEGTNTES